MIRRMKEEDVASVVSLHVATFPTFFLTFLGPRFLRVFYASTLREPGAIAYVNCDPHGNINGFVAGVTDQAAFFRRLASGEKWKFAFAAIGAVVRKPSIVGRLFRALRRPDEAVESSAKTILMSIGVSPAAQGQGLGRALVAAFTEEARNRLVDCYCLTTDRVGNDATNAFYRSAGFELTRTYVTPEGRQMNEYIMRLK